ncbi:cytochrome P450 [Podospora appendiculata]|uniref:Cytochrome P450 n=1 Tax=Podospora appendiculata TaxID=314037 RepID=A0AAE0X1K4_9PEZI|nr:cytochrome P450 [Podospora appendiculata]
MLRDLFQAWPRWATDVFYTVCTIVGWRLWMFTIKPWLRPDEPRDVPYWIPCHTISFFRDYVQLIEDGLHASTSADFKCESNLTGRKREPFSIQLLGKKLYICTDPRDVSTIFDDTVTFGFDDHLSNLLTSFGISKAALKRAWHVPKPGDWCFAADNPVNPKQKSLIHAVEDIFTQQLLPGDHMDVWAAKFLASVTDSLSGSTDDIRLCTTGGDCVWCGGCGGSDQQGGLQRQVSLYRLVSSVSVQATCRGMFGSHLLDIDSQVVEYMLDFNEHAWMMVFQYPSTWGKLPVDEPRERLMKIIRRFVAVPEERRAGASWAITSMLKGMEIVGMDTESRAAMLLMVFWASVSNEHNSCFWLLAHLVHDEALLALVRQETDAAWRAVDGGEPELDIKYLCANAPNLGSIFNEVLRLNNTAAAVRVATKRTVLSGGKAVPKGGMLVLPFRPLHTNEMVWGDDARRFKPTRFLDGNMNSSKTKDTMARNPSFRPFGGGATYCPGRTLAKHEVFGFTAILLRRFDIRLAQTRGSLNSVSGNVKQPFPQLNSTTPSFGLNGPIKGQDVIVDIVERLGV